MSNTTRNDCVESLFSQRRDSIREIVTSAEKYLSLDRKNILKYQSGALSKIKFVLHSDPELMNFGT